MKYKINNLLKECNEEEAKECLENAKRSIEIKRTKKTATYATLW